MSFRFCLLFSFPYYTLFIFYVFMLTSLTAFKINREKGKMILFWSEKKWDIFNLQTYPMTFENDITIRKVSYQISGPQPVGRSPLVNDPSVESPKTVGQIFMLSFITVATKNNVIVGGHHNVKNCVLKGRSLREVENGGLRESSTYCLTLPSLPAVMIPTDMLHTGGRKQRDERPWSRDNFFY